ncbi:MAG: hypothetical protein HC903_28870 [Methylacidiphilales bacterium]|nr:hypothetical protein [Candidatus Methylacidiphilales bacterium]NJR19062.1 hypothetical protein [Calothrix sp. CSU_2_0]
MPVAVGNADPMYPLPFGSSLSALFSWLTLTTIQAYLHVSYPFTALLAGIPH